MAINMAMLYQVDTKEQRAEWVFCLAQGPPDTGSMAEAEADRQDPPAGTSGEGV